MLLQHPKSCATTNAHFLCILYYYACIHSSSAVCYECLPPLASSLAMEERVKFINFDAALKTVDFISEEVKGNKDLTRWAYNIVQTRSFESDDGDIRLTPMADMVKTHQSDFFFLSLCICCCSRLISFLRIS